MIYFTSDTHFGHENIIRLCDRPYGSVDEMNEALIENWNGRVGKRDIVYHLGDFIMGTFADNINLVDRLNGFIHLVPGNHDRVSSAYHHRNVERFQYFWAMYINKGISLLPENTRLTWKKTTFQLSHYPYHGDSHDEDRFRELRPVDNGRWLIHGHVHNEWRVNGRMINAGVDVNEYAPISIDHIYDLITE